MSLTIMGGFKEVIIQRDASYQLTVVQWWNYCCVSTRTLVRVAPPNARVYSGAIKLPI